MPQRIDDPALKSAAQLQAQAGLAREGRPAHDDGTRLSMRDAHELQQTIYIAVFAQERTC